MKLSQHFSRSEMACNCGCGFDTIDVRTLDLMEEVREFVGVAITPSSVARCAAHNKSVGGSKRSMHLFGRAADLPLHHPEEAYNWLCSKYPARYGFGLYTNFVHVDTRTGQPARWDNRGK